MFFLYGLGSNGKSIFITTIRKLTGGYGAKANTSLFMTKDKNSGGPSEDLANLQGKRFVMVSEIEDGRRLAVVLIKEMMVVRQYELIESTSMKLNFSQSIKSGLWEITSR